MSAVLSPMIDRSPLARWAAFGRSISHHSTRPITTAYTVAFGSGIARVTATMPATPRSVEFFSSSMPTMMQM